MKVETYVTAAFEKNGITHKAAGQRMKAALGAAGIRASDTMSENTKQIIDKLCARLQRLAVADTPSIDPNLPKVLPTPEGGLGKFETSLAQGEDPTTGNKVTRVVLNAKEGRMGYYEPVTRATYPMPRSNQNTAKA